MTTIRSGAPRVASPATTSVSENRPLTASTAAAATGHAVASSFQAATGGSGVQAVVSAAKDALADVGGSAKAKVLTMIDKNYCTKQELEEGLAAFTELAQSGDLDQGQYDAIKKAIGWRQAGRTVVSQMLSQMEKMIGEITKKRE